MAKSMDRLDDLEAQSIFIFREAFARLNNIALLWSLGKDSNVIARAAIPFFVCLLLCIAIITVFPSLVTWLPDLVMGVSQ